MSFLGPDALLGTFVLFCRVGAALMLMPGISSIRIPAQVRLFLAVGITLALTPMLLPAVRAATDAASAPVDLVRLISSELFIGILIGFLARLFFLMLQGLASVVSMAIGYGTMPGAPVEEVEAVPALTSLITLSATVLLFAMELHWEVLRGLAISYSVLPPEEGLGAQFGLIQVADRLSEALFLTLRISSPFIIYAVVVNLATGIANKLTPQIPVYFIALPFVMTGGLFLLYYSIHDFLRLFMAGFGDWISGG